MSSLRTFNIHDKNNSTLITMCVVFLIICGYYGFTGLNEVRMIRKPSKSKNTKWEEIFYEWNDPAIYGVLICLGIAIFGYSWKYWDDYYNNIRVQMEQDETLQDLGQEWMRDLGVFFPLMIVAFLIIPLGNLIYKLHDFHTVFFRKIHHDYGVLDKNTCSFKKIKNNYSMKESGELYITLVVVILSIMFIIFTILYNIYLGVRNYTISYVKDMNETVELILPEESINIVSMITCAFLFFSFLVLSIFWTVWGCKTLLKDKPWVKSCQNNGEILNEDQWAIGALVSILGSMILSVGLSI